MAKLPWIDFVHVHPGAHVVWGITGEDAPDLRPIAAKLSAIIERRKPSGDYAVGVVRTSGNPRVACAFADENSARGLAEIVGARAAEQSGSWASECWFTLDADTLRAIERAVGTRRRRRRA